MFLVVIFLGIKSAIILVVVIFTYQNRNIEYVYVVIFDMDNRIILGNGYSAMDSIEDLRAKAQNLRFQNPNGRSEPFNM